MPQLSSTSSRWSLLLSLPLYLTLLLLNLPSLWDKEVMLELSPISLYLFLYTIQFRATSTFSIIIVVVVVVVIISNKNNLLSYMSSATPSCEHHHYCHFIRFYYFIVTDVVTVSKYQIRVAYRFHPWSFELIIEKTEKLQVPINSIPGISQEHDSTPRRLVSVYPWQVTHVLFTKNGPVESECKLNNVNPHIIRNQYQIQNRIEVTSNEDRYCKLCHYQTNTDLQYSIQISNEFPVEFSHE